MNEVTWVETPPPELVEYMSRALGQAEFLNPDGWKDLLEEAGLTGVAASVYKTSALRQWASEVRQMDPRDYLGAWSKFFSLYFKSPAVRKWIKEISIPPRSVFRIFKYLQFCPNGSSNSGHTAALRSAQIRLRRTSYVRKLLYAIPRNS
jgi:hypothetical protein